jgi:hypothetical protein
MIFVGQPRRQRPLGKPRRRWVDDRKIHIRETGYCGMDWIDLARGRDQWRALVNMVINLLLPQNSGKSLSS